MKRWLSVSLAVWLILSIFCGPLAISADTEDSGGFTARRMPLPLNNDKAAAGTVILSNSAGVEQGNLTYHDGRSSQTAGDGSGWQLVTYNRALHTANSPVRMLVTSNPTGLTSNLYALDATTEQTAENANRATSFSYYFNHTQNAVPLAGGEGIMFYVDMPADAAGKTVHNQLSLWFVVQRGSSASWYGLGDSRRRSYALDAAGNLYDLAPDGNRCLTMPSNRFRGYVYIPFASLTNAGGALYTPEAGDKLYQIQMQVRDFGGASGPLRQGSCMITTGSPLYAPRPTLVLFEGESARELFTGQPPAPPDAVQGFTARSMPVPLHNDKAAAGAVILSKNTGVETAGITYHDGRSSQTAGDGSGWQLVTYNGLLRTDQSPVHIKAAVNPTGLISAKAYALGADTVQTAPAANNNKSFNYYFNHTANPVPLAGGEGFLFYVRMPDDAPDTSSHNQIVPWFIIQKASGYTWYHVKNADRRVYALSERGDPTPQALAVSTSGCITLPENGFQGYVYIPFSSLSDSTSAPYTPGAADKLYQIQMQVRDFGEALGAFLNASYMVTTSSPLTADVPYAVRLDGAPAVDIFNGAAPGIRGVSTALQLPFLSGYKLGGQLAADRAFDMQTGSGTSRGDLSIRPVDALNDLSDFPMLEIGTVSAAQPVLDNTAASSKLAVTYRAYWQVDLSGADALMLYLKMPAAPAGTSSFIFSLPITRGGATVTSSLSAGKPFYTLAKGTESWQQQTGAYQTVTLPGGFEGWVRIPLSSFNQPMADAVLTGITFRFRDFGGGLGAGTVGSFLLATNTLMTGDRLVADNRNTAAPLFRDTRIIPAAVQKTLPSLPAENDKVLELNPDRGFRSEVMQDVKVLAANGSYDRMKAAAGQAIENQLAGQGPTTVMQVYLYLSGYNSGDIPQAGLDAVEAFLDALKSRNKKALLRFAYAKDIGDAATDAPQAIMLRHMDQLAPVVSRWKDTIHALQAGIVGAWGEWHGESYAIDKTAVLNKIVGTLLPPGTYLQMRLPDYKNLLPSSHPAYSRIGIHNDAVFGKIPNRGYGTGGLDAGSAQWNQLVTQAPYAPQDGELYYSTWNQTNNVYCDGYEAIRQFSEHRFTTFSHYHGYWDAGGTAQTAMGRWKNLAVTPAWLASNGIVGSPAWFTDRNRQPIARNAFAFVEAHLGYRLEAQDVTIHSSGAPGSTAHVSLSLKNYGFSAAFNLQSGFAILDEDNRVVSQIDAGTPAAWHSRSPGQYSDATILRHRVGATMTLPATPGRYKLTFYLKNGQGSAARLANGVRVIDGYHTLHTFDVQ